MSSNGYNKAHWQKKIPSYLNEDWSNRPSPFVQIVKTYLKPSGRVLELGAGAGQDGLWLEQQGFTVTISDGDDVVFDAITAKSSTGIKPIKFDLTGRFPFADNSFDVVYAQLVLHYFDDQTTKAIMSEIQRVLTKDGVFACMVNSVSDPEYVAEHKNDDGLLEVNGLIKRFFSKESFNQFVEGFEALLFDEEGRTPKDDAVGTTGLVQFIGRNKK